MRIGIFTDTYTPEINGVVSSVVTLQKGLEAQGHDVFIITSHKGLLHSKKEGNVFRMPGMELKWLYGYILSTPYHFTIKAEVEKLNLDVIHVHTEFGVGVFGRIVARVLHIPVVYTYHTLYEDYTHYINKFDLETVEKVSKKVFSSFTKYLCSSVSSIIAPSEKTQEILAGYGVRRPIHVIPTGLDMDRFKPENVSQSLREEIKQRYGIDENVKLVTYIGRVAEEKSIDIIIDAIPYLQNTNVKMMIVGGGPSLEDLKQQAKQLKVEDKVIFTDRVPREEVAAYYLVSDAFVSASTTETQGMTFIEALASGLPVFARPDEVLDDLVIEDKTGYYFTTPQEFASKVDAFFTINEEKRNGIQQNALSAVKKYDVETFVRDVFTVYQEAVMEYQGSYTVRMIKSSNDCMKVYLEAQDHEREENVLISLEDYMLFQIKKDEVIESYLFDVLKEKEKIILAYRMCIRRLQTKDRTRKEMYDFLIQQEKVPLTIKQINDLIQTLEDKGYINDEAYTVVQIERLSNALYGKQKIIRSLVNKGIPYQDVEKNLYAIDDEDEIAKATKQANKYMMSIKNKAVQHKKQMIYDKLYRDGYATHQIQEVLHSLNFEEDILLERMNVIKAVEKAKRNYMRKYSGKELRNKIITSCLRKGFLYDDISVAIEEEEQQNG